MLIPRRFRGEARAECEALIEAMTAAEAAWADARERLAKLESLRDALGEDLAELDGRPQSLPVVSRGEVRSAA